MARTSFVLIALAALAGPARAGQVVERIAAVVNEEIILDTELEQWAAPQVRGSLDLDTSDGRKSWDDMKRKALDGLIDMKLEQQQATELKLSVTPEEIDRAVEAVREQNKLDEATFREALKQQGFTMDSYRKTLKTQLLQLKVENTTVRARVNVSDEEVRAWYNQNVRALSGEQQAHLRWALVAVAPGAAPADVERKKRVAQEIVELTRGKKKPFTEVARQLSDDELTKKDGGDLGWIGHGVLEDALENAVAAMDAGDVRGPIRTQRGWVVLQLVERKAGAVRPFDEVKEEIRKQLYGEQVDKARAAWLRELRKKAHVEIRL
jgi:peptidyl-prolyl cis-trans isomerase SurA